MRPPLPLPVGQKYVGVSSIYGGGSSHQGGFFCTCTNGKIFAKHGRKRFLRTASNFANLSVRAYVRTIWYDMIRAAHQHDHPCCWSCVLLLQGQQTTNKRKTYHGGGGPYEWKGPTYGVHKKTYITLSRNISTIFALILNKKGAYISGQSGNIHSPILTYNSWSYLLVWSTVRDITYRYIGNLALKKRSSVYSRPVGRFSSLMKANFFLDMRRRIFFSLPHPVKVIHCLFYCSWCCVIFFFRANSSCGFVGQSRQKQQNSSTFASRLPLLIPFLAAKLSPHS